MSLRSRPASPDQTIETTQEWLQQAKRADAQQWIQRSLQADDPQTALDYAQRAMDFLPDDPQVHLSVQRSIVDRLRRDAFVAFLAETDANYVIRFRDSRPVAVPKTRAQPEPFPAPRRTEGQRVSHLIGWMLLGLIPVGIGAVILGPLVVVRALGVITGTNVTGPDLKRAWLTIFLALPITFLGIFFVLLLLLHVIG